MSAINTENFPEFMGQDGRSGRRYDKTAASRTSSLKRSTFSLIEVFGFLMALMTAALLMLTTQPSWVLLPAAAGLVLALLLSKVLKEGLQA